MNENVFETDFVSWTGYCLDFFTQKASADAQSTKFKVTLDTTVMHACVCRWVEQKTAVSVTCPSVHAIGTQV